MKAKQHIYKEIYHSTGFKDRRTEKFVKQEQKKLGLTNNEMRKIIILSYNWAFILFHTTDNDVKVRQELLWGYMQQKKFNLRKTKENFLDHPYIKFFNLLVDFCDGKDVYKELVSMFVIDYRHDTYYFRWNDK